MPTLCPACGFPLVEGALRCKSCGADARRAERGQGTAAGFRPLEMAPGAFLAAQAMDELAEFAPEVLDWVKRASRPQRERLAEVLGKLVKALRAIRG